MSRHVIGIILRNTKLLIVITILFVQQQNAGLLLLLLLQKFINRTVSIILNQRRVGEWQAKMAIVTTT